MAPSSAIPNAYYAIFGFYEPFLCIVGMLGSFADPKGAHDSQASWSNHVSPPESLSHATLVTIIQLGHVCGLLGLINIFVLTAARRHLAHLPAIQEKIVASLLAPLLLGDFTHTFVTLWALGDKKWVVSEWGQMTQTGIGLGITLMIPRIMWWLGVGRFVQIRDGLVARRQPLPQATIKN